MQSRTGEVEGLKLHAAKKNTSFHVEINKYIKKLYRHSIAVHLSALSRNELEIVFVPFGGQNWKCTVHYQWKSLSPRALEVISHG